jgi:hypothetical protein
MEFSRFTNEDHLLAIMSSILLAGNGEVNDTTTIKRAVETARQILSAVTVVPMENRE